MKDMNLRFFFGPLRFVEDLGAKLVFKLYSYLLKVVRYIFMYSIPLHTQLKIVAWDLIDTLAFTF